MRRRAAASLAVLTVALLAGPSTAQSAPQGPWALPQVDLSATGQDTTRPQLSIAPDGAATVVWQRSNGANSIIQAATRPPGESYGAAVDLSVAGQNATRPQVADSSDGETTAVWQRSNGSNTLIQAATRPSGGSFGAPEDLSAPGQNANSAQTAIAPDGTVTTVWRRSDGSDTIIQATTRSPGGSPGTPVDLSVPGENAVDPQVAVAPDGTVTVVWWRSDGSDNIIQAATRPPGGTFGTPVNLSAPGNNAFEPQIATSPDGVATVVWFRDDGSNFLVQAATRPEGGTFGTPVDLSAPGDDAFEPQIATSSDGTATAVWHRSDGSHRIIQAATRPPGSSFAAPVDLSLSGEDTDGSRIAAAPDGTVTAVWERDDSSNNSIIQAATRPPGGNFGVPVDLSAKGQDAAEPEVEIDPTGVATAVWVRSNGTNDIAQTISTALPSFSLGIAKSGSGNGTITSTPAGIDCGSDCTKSLTAYTEVTLTATPDSDSSFSGWGGACSGEAGNTCQLNMTEDRNVVANFAAREARLKIRSFKPKNPRVKRSKAVKVTASNTGNATAEKAKLCARPSKSVKKAIKLKGKSCQSLGSLAAGKSKTRAFKLTATSRAKKGKTYKVDFTLKAKGVKTAKSAVKVKVK